MCGYKFDHLLTLNENRLYKYEHFKHREKTERHLDPSETWNIIGSR